MNWVISCWMVCGGLLYIPDANFGAFYTSASIFGGISVMQIFQSSIHFGDDNGSEYRLKRNYNLMAGYYYEVTSDIAIEPSLLVKIPTSSKATTGCECENLL